MANKGYTLENVKINPLLTNFMQGYNPPGFISEIIAPNKPVTNIAGQFLKVNIDDYLRTYETIVANNVRANSIEKSFGTDTYTCVQHRLEGFISDQIAKEAPSIMNYQNEVVADVKYHLEQARQIRIANILKDPTIIANTDALVAGQEFNNYDSATSLPLQSIVTAVGKFKLLARESPNTIVIPEHVALALSAHPTMQDLMESQYAMQFIEGITLPQTIMRMKVVIATQFARLPNSETAVEIWGDNIYLLKVNPNPGVRTRDCIVTFVNQDYTVKTVREELIDGTVAVGSHVIVEKVVDSTLAYVLTNVME